MKMSCNSCKNIPKILEIDDIIKEGKNTKSFFFKHSLDSKPGQFIMVWIPGVDEKPMAVSYHKKNEFGFTTQASGKFTSALCALKKGDQVGIRGPYGSSFSIKDNACIVGGGIGMASVATLIDKSKSPVIINGARNKDHLAYIKRYNNKNMIVTTDDGSYGRKGFTTEALKEVLEKNAKKSKISGTNFVGKKISIVQTCGPEIMMKKILDICTNHNVKCEASLERMMKCGFGVCGACMCNDKLVCLDGPVFTSEQLNKMSEFGNFARLKSGKKVSLNKYHS